MFRANSTFFVSLTDSPRGVRFVLRKKPSGALLSHTAHAVEREFKILSALRLHNERTKDEFKRIPIPDPIILCEDKYVIGTPFYIMQFLEGRIFADFKMPQLSPEERKAWCVLIIQQVPGLMENFLQLVGRGSHSCTAWILGSEDPWTRIIRSSHSILPPSDQRLGTNFSAPSRGCRCRYKRKGRADSTLRRVHTMVLHPFTG